MLQFVRLIWINYHVIKEFFVIDEGENSLMVVFILS